MGLGKKAGSQDSTIGKNMVSRVLRFLCSNTPHNRADIFKYNLDVVRLISEYLFVRYLSYVIDYLGASWVKTLTKSSP